MDRVGAGTRKRVCVTGAAGLIGKHVCRALLARGHLVRGFDRVAAPEVADHQVGDLTDANALERAFAGMDVVIHLAAIPTEADFMEALLENNIVGTYRVFEAARERHVDRVIAASSVQAVNGHVDRRRVPVRVEDGTAPTNYYGVTKTFAEQLGLMHALQGNLSVLMVRPGWVPRSPAAANEKPGGQARIYLSHDDAGRFFTAAVESEKPERPGFGIAFALSCSGGEPMYDLSSAEELLGYKPKDSWPEGLHF